MESDPGSILLLGSVSLASTLMGMGAPPAPFAASSIATGGQFGEIVMVWVADALLPQPVAVAVTVEEPDQLGEKVTAPVDGLIELPLAKLVASRL